MLAPLGRAVVVSWAPHRSSRDVDHRTAPCLTQLKYVRPVSHAVNIRGSRRVRSSPDRPARDLRLEGGPGPGHHPPAVAAALGRPDGPAALGVGRRGDRRERAPEARADRSSPRDRPEAVAAYDPGGLAR